MPITAFAPPQQVASAGGAGAPPAAGSVTHLPFPVTLNGGLWTDPGGCVWYAPNGNTIGNINSGAAIANLVVENLYKSLWWHIVAGTSGWSIQTSGGVSAGAGATASDDWFANKRLIIPDMRGRAIISSGQGSGLTERAPGARGGAEFHALNQAENGPHGHGVTDPGHIHGGAFFRDGAAFTIQVGSGSPQQVANTLPANTSISIQNSGSGTPHNNMQPWAAYQELWSTGQRISVESGQPTSALIGALVVPAPLVGSAIYLSYPVTLTGGLWVDENGFSWLAPNGVSIGGLASGAEVSSLRLEKLFKALWVHLNAGTTGWSIQASTGAGSAAGTSSYADWTAGKRLFVPDQRGRVPIAAGQGSGLTLREVGARGGAESHALTAPENGPHAHAPNASGQFTVNRNSPIEGYGFTTGTGLLNVLAGTTTAMSGNGNPHPNMQPWAGYTLLWSLGERA